MVLAQKGQEWPEGTLPQNEIAALWAVTGDITKGPDSLLAHIINT